MELNLKHEMKNVLKGKNKPSAHSDGEGKKKSGYPYVKPFSIANFGQRKELGYAFASESEEESKARK